MDTARFMAIVWTSAADGAIGCFNAKYAYSFWRPVTAIPVGGGNPDLAADPAWLPLGITPNHPEYPAAHACVTGALSHAVEGYFGTPKVQVVVDSLVFKDAVTHTPSKARAIGSAKSSGRVSMQDSTSITRLWMVAD